MLPQKRLRPGKTSLIRHFGAGIDLCFLAAMSLAVGCSQGSAPARHPVAGEVTLDGQPLPTGVILFLPLEAGDPTEADVKEGRFQLPRDRGLEPGKYRVEIRSLQGTGKRVPGIGPGGTTEEKRERIPEKYNQKSILTATFEPQQSQPLQFELSSK